MPLYTRKVKRTVEIVEFWSGAVYEPMSQTKIEKYGQKQPLELPGQTLTEIVEEFREVTSIESDLFNKAVKAIMEPMDR
jgi:hypothetical protein